MTTESDSSESSVSENSEHSSSSSYYENLYSPHPYSYVVREELTFKDSFVFASVILDIRLTDQAFISKFGPFRVNFGGTYGNTFIPEDLRRIVDELRVVKCFKIIYALGSDAVTKAEAEGLLWQNTVADRVDQAIWSARNRRISLQNDPEAYDQI